MRSPNRAIPAASSSVMGRRLRAALGHSRLPARAATGERRRCHIGSERDLVARIREARRRLAADGPPRVRSGGDFERVSVPVPTPLSRPPLLHLDSPPAGRFLDLAWRIGVMRRI
jgi:hypothetical protein